MLTIKSSQFSSVVETDDQIIDLEFIRIRYFKIFNSLIMPITNDIQSIGYRHGVNNINASNLVKCVSNYKINYKQIIKSNLSVLVSTPVGVVLPMQPPPTLVLLYNGNEVSNLSFYISEGFNLDFKCEGYNIKGMTCKLDFVDLSGMIVSSKSVLLDEESPYITAKELLSNDKYIYYGQFLFTPNNINLSDLITPPIELRYYVSVHNNRSKYFIVNSGAISFLKR